MKTEENTQDLAQKSWFMKQKARRFASKSKRMIDSAMKGVGQEAKETEEMVKSFFSLLESKLDLKRRKVPPTEEEVKAAVEQLKDLGRFSVFATISIIPGGGFSLIGLELLAKKFGLKKFTFLPSAFRKRA
jgi:parvulin-like peptidyl-prolyl isomerase